MGDIIMHWNDFFMVIALVTGVCTFIMACRYGIMYDDSDYDRNGARKLLYGLLVVFTIAAALAWSIK